MHHERQDGSGYHRQATAATIPNGARLLAAADAYQAMTQERAHRPASHQRLPPNNVSFEAAQGRLDAEAVRAVLETAGHPPPRLTWPASLSDREIQVLRLVARGRTEIGRLLWISPKTAGHHVQHLRQDWRLTRAAAAMFAMEHDLIRE